MCEVIFLTLQVVNLISFTNLLDGSIYVVSNYTVQTLIRSDASLCSISSSLLVIVGISFLLFQDGLVLTALFLGLES